MIWFDLMTEAKSLQYSMEQSAKGIGCYRN